MKKFLLCMLLAGLMMPVVAQEKLSLKSEKINVSEMTADLGLGGILPINPKGALFEVGGWKSVGFSESYDRQSQGSIYPMTQIHGDGFIGATWTTDDNLPFEGGGSTPLRGVAYTFSTDGGKTWEDVDSRVGGIPLYWPSYVQWGPNGEAILARSADTYEYEGFQVYNGLVLLTRENKGVGEWTRRVVPYPEGTPLEDGFIMAWSRMATSGENNQYIQIMTHTRGATGQYYKGYYQPVFYYRTQDGGETWDVAGELVPEMAGATWTDENPPEGPAYTDQISIATHGDIVAVTFIRLGYHNFLLKSYDNGDTWTITKFFHSPTRWYTNIEECADTCFIPTQGIVALDNNGMAHIAFGTWMAANTADHGTLSLWRGPGTSFLSYWNEEMPPLDGEADFNIRRIYDEIIWEKFLDQDLTNPAEGQLYVKTTTPEWPVIGFFTPISDENIFLSPTVDNFDWVQQSYGRAGTFSFPQMEFDGENKLHLAYLGLLDNGNDDVRWKRHPFYTIRDTDETWSQTEYLVNHIDLVDREFAYLTSAGVHDKKMYLMAQVDPYAGTFQPYAGQTVGDHSATINSFYFFYIDGLREAINEVDYTPLTMSVFPNPASGQATVKLEGRKGNVTVYNMLGQTVYHVENVENSTTIPLNMASGVYFVTVRSGNATATQKLIVK